MENDVTLTNLTAERMKVSSESAYNLLKELYTFKSEAVDKTEDKIAKLSEKLVDQRQELEELAQELESIKESYNDYCVETGMEAASV